MKYEVALLFFLKKCFTCTAWSEVERPLSSWDTRGGDYYDSVLNHTTTQHHEKKPTIPSFGLFYQSWTSIFKHVVPRSRWQWIIIVSSLWKYNIFLLLFSFPTILFALSSDREEEEKKRIFSLLQQPINYIFSFRYIHYFSYLMK